MSLFLSECAEIVGDNSKNELIRKMTATVMKALLGRKVHWQAFRMTLASGTGTELVLIDARVLNKLYFQLLFRGR